MKSLFNLFQNLVIDDGHAIDETEAVTLAATAMMLEVARSDQVKQEIEFKTIKSILEDTLNVRQESVNDLISSAEESVETAHDLYQFTQVINELYDYKRKKQLVLTMWQVAFADGQVEAMENHIIRRLAGLIHVSHSDLIQLKIQARNFSY